MVLKWKKLVTFGKQKKHYEDTPEGRLEKAGHEFEFT